ncbi:MAG: hydroxymethylbilane synthase [Deltaproteobacteria bacterium]|uniref:hydroxymethylbilane synthase n=1 Tax=Desulfobacula sp. TaxID=2593537 RepID=UPI0019CEE2E0|nr:hydroxymethylbilane synthase [Candidatus Desulfobacula maris]MBL6994650.1 hydroxymethylbilane synthase [Desulfobacula sp.]
MKKKICIGTRGSQLALWQANFIKSEIEHLFPDLIVELKIIKTTGDMITDRPLAMVGGKGLFVKEIETALLNNDIDIAVHSMKDMPGKLPCGLIIGAIPERENPFDVLISKDNSLLTDYKKGAKIGTSSLRRASQIKHIRPDVIIESIRGNLDTRIKKLKAGDYDAIVLAAAGLRRLGQDSAITEYLDETIMIPAVGQGALCIETRDNDDDIAAIMKKLDHRDTRICVTGERAFLKQIEGSCHIPVACFGKIKGHDVLLTAVVASEDGKELIKEHILSPINKVEPSGQALAVKVLEKGGKKILEQLNANDR